MRVTRQLLHILFFITIWGMFNSHCASAVEMGEGLVAEWTFQEGAGESVRDTSDNNKAPHKNERAVSGRPCQQARFPARLTFALKDKLIVGGQFAKCPDLSF